MFYQLASPLNSHGLFGLFVFWVLFACLFVEGPTHYVAQVDPELHPDPPNLSHAFCFILNCLLASLVTRLCSFSYHTSPVPLKGACKGRP